MKVDKARLESYLDQIAAEALDLEQILSGGNEGVLEDVRLVKSLKYSTIVIAEAMAGALQHILAKRHNTVVNGYLDVFKKSRDFRLLPDELLGRLQPFISFRNMLVHQYWRVSDQVFLENLREGLGDFRDFVRHMRSHLGDE